MPLRTAFLCSWWSFFVRWWLFSILTVIVLASNHFTHTCYTFQFGAIPEYHMFDFRQVWLLKLIKISQNSLELQHFNSDASARNESAIQCSKGCQPAPRVQFGNFSLVFLSSQYWMSRSMSITKPAFFYIGGTFQVVQGLGHPGFLSFFLRLDPGFNIYVGNIKVQMFISWSLSLIQCNAMLCLVQKLRELEVWLLKI